MPADNGFDWQKVYFALRDIERTTRSQPAKIALKIEPEKPTVIRGTADREGLIGFGLNLAVSALEAGTSLAVQPDGTIQRDGGSGLIEIAIVESPSVSRMRGSPTKTSRVFLAIASVLSVIGAYTALGWLIRAFGR